MESIAYGANRYSLCYFTPSRRCGGSAAMVFPRELESSLDAQESNVASLYLFLLSSDIPCRTKLYEANIYNRDGLPTAYLTCPSAQSANDSRTER